MNEPSKHLNDIMSKNNQTANLQVVFLDIEKYSKRRSLTQVDVIEAFTKTLSEALKETSRKFVGYSQTNDLNFHTDVITIPTGDGCATIFSFDGLPDIHLYFAKQMLQAVHEANHTEPCQKFEQDGWCNCHDSYHVRIGVSEGRGIIYKDVNGNYNVAGDVINMASRVMGLGDRNHIVFTDAAFHQIIDLVDDPSLVEEFVEFPKIKVKFDVEVNVHQYVGRSEDYLNRDTPKHLEQLARMKSITKTLQSAGIPGFPDEIDDGLAAMEAYATATSEFRKMLMNAQEGTPSVTP